MTLSLSHKCYNIFNGKIDEALFGDKSTISFSFSNNTSGVICELSIPLDQSVKSIVFKWKADSDLFSTDYLKPFEGIFGEHPLLYGQSLVGKKLVAVSIGKQARKFSWFWQLSSPLWNLVWERLSKLSIAAHQDGKRADEIQKGNNCVFWDMVVEFGRIECVMEDPGHKLAGFMLIIEFEGGLLIRIEQLGV